MSKGMLKELMYFKNLLETEAHEMDKLQLLVVTIHQNYDIKIFHIHKPANLELIKIRNKEMKIIDKKDICMKVDIGLYYKMPRYTWDTCELHDFEMFEIYDMVESLLPDGTSETHNIKMSIIEAEITITNTKEHLIDDMEFLINNEIDKIINKENLCLKTNDVYPTLFKNTYIETNDYNQRVISFACRSF